MGHISISLGKPVNDFAYRERLESVYSLREPFLNETAIPLLLGNVNLSVILTGVSLSKDTVTGEITVDCEFVFGGDC